MKDVFYIIKKYFYYEAAFTAFFTFIEYNRFFHFKSTT
jgi:hypothetical protein